jgi:mannose-1-phosphate guanylyltransferase
MTTTDHYFCVILAGGLGRRLWPCSRVEKPKQFIDFFGQGRTQLQQTYDRMANIIQPEHIFVSTNIDYLDMVKEQLPGLDDFHVLAEPIHRNTAPSTAWALHRITSMDEDASFIVTPSDMVVMDDVLFRQNVMDGLDFVGSHDAFLSMGVRPTRPEPGYGYIQLGDPLGKDVYRVKSFTEKPEREFATMFLESGEFYWNTGIFLAKAVELRKHLFGLLPPVLRQLDHDNPNARADQENDYMMEHFPSYPNLSLDSAILEKSQQVCVMKCQFGWADLGTWHSIYEAMQKTDDDNVIVDSDVLMENCHRNVIKLPKDKVGVINGLEGFIVAEKDNVLLICPKEDSSALIRKYVNEIQLRKGDKYV